MRPWGKNPKEEMISKLKEELRKECYCFFLDRETVKKANLNVKGVKKQKIGLNTMTWQIITEMVPGLCRSSIQSAWEGMSQVEERQQISQNDPGKNQVHMLVWEAPLRSRSHWSGADWWFNEVQRERDPWRSVICWAIDQYQETELFHNLIPKGVKKKFFYGKQ